MLKYFLFKFELKLKAISAARFEALHVCLRVIVHKVVVELHTQVLPSLPVLNPQLLTPVHVEDLFFYKCESLDRGRKLIIARCDLITFSASHLGDRLILSDFKCDLLEPSDESLNIDFSSFFRGLFWV